MADEGRFREALTIYRQEPGDLPAGAGAALLNLRPLGDSQRRAWIGSTKAANLAGPRPRRSAAAVGTRRGLDVEVDRPVLGIALAPIDATDSSRSSPRRRIRLPATVLVGRDLASKRCQDIVPAHTLVTSYVTDDAAQRP